jgi:thiamine biosynthesis protein ThiI
VARLVDEMDQQRMLSLRRFMYAVAEGVAERVGAVGIVSGEAIGQKSSQTAANLAVTSAATTLPVHRPLVTMDKPEIEARAREIGTYHDSTIPAGCNRVAPSLPETDARLAAVEAAEPTDLFDLAAAAAEGVASLP